MKKETYTIVNIVLDIIKLIILILACAFFLYLTVNEQTAKYKIYRHINENIEL